MTFIDRGAVTTAICHGDRALDMIDADGWNVIDTVDAETKHGRLLLALTAEAPAAAFQQNGDITVVAAYPGPKAEAGNDPAWDLIERFTGQFSKKMPLAMIVEKAYLAGREDADRESPPRESNGEKERFAGSDAVPSGRNGRRGAPRPDSRTHARFIARFKQKEKDDS